MRFADRTTLLLLVCSECGGRTPTLAASSGEASGASLAASDSSVGSGSTASATGSAAGVYSGSLSASNTGAGAGSQSGSAVVTSDAACDGACLPAPVSHRPDDSECQVAAPVGTCHATSSTTDNTEAVCHTDSQCATGTNGRCQQLTGLSYDYCACTYDTCTTDGDCGPGQTCACHGAPNTDGAGNTCVPGNCRVDGDCGPGGYCSPSYGGEPIQGCPVAGRGLQGYYCHTVSDTCLDQSDCPNPFAESCAYSATMGFWRCTPLPGGDGCSVRDQ
jgi:hypothetical protein